MLIKDLYLTKRPVLSLEVFPPKPDYPLSTIYRTLDKLHALRPDFISVTYGAGGSNRGRTVEIAKHIRDAYGIESLAHLTCIGHTRSEIDGILSTLSDSNIGNILALRGDLPNTGEKIDPARGEFRYARDLIAYIKTYPGFCLGAAAYPEGHPQSASLDEDTERLKEKIDTGVDFLITQLFLDNRFFYRFLERIRKAGISVPVSAGIMPVLNTKIQKIIDLSGATVPDSLLRLIQKYEGRPEDMEKAGIEFAVRQINDLLASGVDGIHLYTMNKAEQSGIIIQEIRKPA